MSGSGYIKRLVELVDFKTEKVRDIPEWARQTKSWTNFKERKLTSSGESHCIYHYGRTLGPGRYADVGVFRGGSVAALAHGLKDAGDAGVIYAIDLFGERPDSANCLPNVETPGILRAYFAENFPRVTLKICKGDSVEWGKQLDPPFRFVFIDADHSYEGCKRDVETYGPLVEMGGVMAFHDTNLETVNQVIRELPKNQWKLERHVFTIKAFRRI